MLYEVITIIPVEKAFEIYEKIILSEKQTVMYKNGVKLDANRINVDLNCENYRVYSFDEKFLGTATIKKETMELICTKNFFEN